jgi:hypothetical protein
MHHTIVHNGVPVMDIAVDIVRKHAEPESAEKEHLLSSESSEESGQETPSAPSLEQIFEKIKSE